MNNYNHKDHNNNNYNHEDNNNVYYYDCRDYYNENIVQYILLGYKNSAAGARSQMKAIPTCFRRGPTLWLTVTIFYM